MIAAFVILAALLVVPCAVAVVLGYGPVWVGQRLRWWR